MRNPKKLIRKARALKISGDYASALEIYKSILNLYPRNKEAKQGVSELAKMDEVSISSLESGSEKYNDLKETSSWIIRSNLKIDLNKEEYEYLTAYYRARNFASLLEYISELSKQHPSVTNLFHLAAVIHYESNNFPAAIHEFRRVLILDPNSFDANLGIARSFSSLRDFDQAKYHLEVALAIEPDSLIALKYLGASVASLGLFEEAVKIFRDGIKKHPKSEDLFIQLAKLFQDKKDFPASLKVLEHAITSIGQTERILQM